MDSMDFLPLRRKILSQKSDGAPISLTYDEADNLILLAREVWELRRTSAKEADARIAGYAEGQRDLLDDLAILLLTHEPIPMKNNIVPLPVVRIELETATLKERRRCAGIVELVRNEWIKHTHQDEATRLLICVLGKCADRIRTEP